MKTGLVLGISIVLIVGSGLASTMRTIPLTPSDIKEIGDLGRNLLPSCELSYFYLINGCGYVTVVEAIEEAASFGVHFNMVDTVAWRDPCDTAACMTMDIIDLVFYDVLAPPAEQGLNVKIYGADTSGEPTGPLLGNRDFDPFFVDTARVTVTGIDFTNNGQGPGLDLSGCNGAFVVLVTWKNPTGHPSLVLDDVCTCVDSCAVNAFCCEMGTTPYVYPRLATHTYDYGTEWAWSKQDSFCDLCGCMSFGYLEALWTCGFCTQSAATEPTTWSTIKALYR
ncbi:MAG: hypothetical protein ABIJ00_08540 [Candidatus Eisenbacteria bacterium]